MADHLFEPTSEDAVAALDFFCCCVFHDTSTVERLMIRKCSVRFLCVSCAASAASLICLFCFLVWPKLAGMVGGETPFSLDL